MTYGVMTQGHLLEGQQVNAELFNSWLRYLDAKEKTVETYTRAVRRFVRYLQDNGITQPTREDVLQYRDSLQQEGKKAATVQLYTMALKQFFNWTEQEGLYKNIARNVKGAKQNFNAGFKRDYLTSAQAADLLKTVDTSDEAGSRDFAIIALMVTTGLRTVEVIRADVEDLRTRGDSTVLYLQGKGRDDKADFVKIPAQVEEALRAYLKQRGKTEPKQPLFTSSANRNRGQRMTTRSISRICKTNLQAAGFNSDRLTAHSLRHTAATLNLLNGGTLEETKNLLRHSSMNTTLIYAHALDRDSNNSENRIANAIFG